MTTGIIIVVIHTHVKYSTHVNLVIVPYKYKFTLFVRGKLFAKYHDIKEADGT